MNELPWQMWFSVATVLCVVAFALAAAVWLVSRSLNGHRGSWRELAGHFPADSCPAGDRTSGQTLQVGRVTYKNCVTVILASEGLYLNAGFALNAFGCRPLLIPWNQFRGERPAMLHWQPSHKLQIGEPEVGTITVKQALYQQIASFQQSGPIDAEVIAKPDPA